MLLVSIITTETQIYKTGFGFQIEKEKNERAIKEHGAPQIINSDQGIGHKIPAHVYAMAA